MRTNTTSSILNAVNGITCRVGVIYSSTGAAKTNAANDGTNFALVPGGRYVVQTVEAVDVAITPSPLAATETDIATVTADPNKDLVIAGKQPVMVCLSAGQTVLSVAAADGASAFHLKVTQLF